MRIINIQVYYLIPLIQFKANQSLLKHTSYVSMVFDIYIRFLKNSHQI